MSLISNKVSEEMRYPKNNKTPEEDNICDELI
jgi:hypothetical protein